MDINIISREIIKPSYPSLENLKPQKLCLFDQLTPFTYPAILLFYPMLDNPNTNLHQIITKLKKCLSKALNLYYPFSGRVKNNLYVDNFDVGIPFFVAKINSSMSDFLKLKEIETLNKLVSIQPFSRETDFSCPFLSFQINVFSFGGIALGISVCHKYLDGATTEAFLTTWAAIFSESYHKVINPNISQASLLFPPRDQLPQNYTDLMDQLWFQKGNYVTRRFVFDAKSISILRERAKSEKVLKPSRNEALTCFIWKHTMKASWAISGSPRTSIAAHAVNMRPRSKKNSLDNAIGNLFWWTAMVANPSNEEQMELQFMVRLMRESISGFDEDFLESMQKEDGFSVVSEFLEQLEGMLCLEAEKPDILGFTSWGKFFNDIDFGWGKPFWVGANGKVGSEFRNMVIFVDTQWGKGIEAWITLEDKQMALLESDSEFIAFASPRVGISSSL